MFCFCNFHSRGKRERNGRNGYCRTKHTEPLTQEITTGGDSIAIIRDQKRPEKGTESPFDANICMNFLDWVELQ